MSAKVCTRCREALAESEFSVDSSRKDGLQTWCKACHARYRRSAAGKAAHTRYVESPKGREARARRARWTRAQFPERVKANNAVNHAIRGGRLVREPCEVCGAEPAEGHHDDYSKPLDVRWLCPGPECHPRADAERRALEMAVA